MLNRVTNNTTAMTAQRNLQSSQARLAALQDQAMTLQKIKRPSDDPAAAAAALQTRAGLTAVGQYGRNIDDGGGWLAASDAALSRATNVLNRVRDLTVQAGNGALSVAAKEGIAVELESLNKELLAAANTKHLGRSLFAGTSDAAAAFSSSVPPAFSGAAGTVERRIGPDQTVRVDSDGAAIFGDRDESVFAAVAAIAAGLRSGADVTPRLAQVDGSLKAIVGGRADVGARQALLERAGNINTELEASLEARRTDLEVADLGSTILDLKLQETNYQAALGVTARVLQPSLMDYLR